MEEFYEGVNVMDMKTEIKRLARLEDSAYPFCSLYLNTKWDDEQQRERIRLFTKNQLKKALDELHDHDGLKKAFLEDQEQIERFVEKLVRRVYEEEVNGIAVFSCSGSGVFFTYPSMIPFENQFFISDHPTLRPLVRLSTQYQNTLAVMVETDSARLFEISLEGVIGESSVESYVPGRHDQGGWAQMRYQRHIQDHRDRHHKEVAEQLTGLFDSGGWKNVVLIGQDRIVSNFKTFLPERVKQHIVDVFPLDFSEERSKVILRILDRLLQKEKEEVDRQIQGITERALKTGMATLGLNETLEALHRGQVHTLYLLTKTALPGGKCIPCRSYLPVSSAPCPLCKGETKAVDLGEELIRLALRQDGEVKLVEDNPVLKENQGVGASLRFHS
jgi:peptide chain release factor subunit 1